MALTSKIRGSLVLGIGAGVLAGCLSKVTPLEIGDDTGLSLPEDTGIVDSGPLEDTSNPDPDPDPDLDGDGVPASEDCDDTNPDVFPGATEVCDGVDNDCDELVDDADDSLDKSSAPIWYTDFDGDGYGAPTTLLEACEPPSGWVADSGDCDDGNADVFPGAVELCNWVDDDCDTQVDEGLPDADSSGTPDCKEVAVVISAGFDTHSDEGQCEGVSYLERELQELEGFLGELGLSPVVFTDQADTPLAYSSVAPYPVVIYHNGGWAEPGTTSAMDALENASSAGKGLFFLGDDHANHAQKTVEDSGKETLFKLAGIDSYLENGSESEVTAASPTHPVMDGDHGVVGTFDYVADIDWTTAAGRGEVVLMQTSLGPVALGSELGSGQRTLTMMASLYNSHDCPITDTDGRVQLERFFKNGMTWLMDW